MEGFAPIESPSWKGWIKEGEQATLLPAFLEGTGCAPVTGGRGTTFLLELESGKAYLRRYQRGGAVRFILKKSYYNDNRALREFELLLKLKRNGLPVPEVLGACWKSRLGWYQGAIATRALEGETLYDYLRNTRNNPEYVLREAGMAIRKLHDLHVWHADLQLRNIMATPDGVYLIDFDNACQLKRWPQNAGHRNMLRLKRSFEKSGIPVSCFDMICEGYGGNTPPKWLRDAYRLKGLLSDGIGGRQKDHE